MTHDDLLLWCDAARAGLGLGLIAVGLSGLLAWLVARLCGADRRCPCDPDVLRALAAVLRRRERERVLLELEQRREAYQRLALAHRRESPGLAADADAAAGALAEAMVGLRAES